MTRNATLLQLGVGQVGTAVAQMIATRAPHWLADDGVEIRYYAVADSTAFVVLDAEGTGKRDSTGSQLSRVLDVRARQQRLAAMEDAIAWSRWERVLAEALERARAPEQLVVLDCASGSATTPMLLAARTAGAHVVLANKDPLAATMATYRALVRGNGRGSLRMSATVGAGLPVLAMLRTLTATGDHLIELRGQVSGSLGYICSALSAGVPFDEAVRQATTLGYTEPDARQDLSGFDVARKLLILARATGAERELTDVRVENLAPPGAEGLPPAEFRASLPSFAEHLADRAANARANGRVLRYIARMAEDGALSASLRELAADDPVALGHGPDNVFVVRTMRYHDRPLSIAGPGAGVDVTATAVVADMLRTGGIL